jgi:hypothetical protein
VKVKFSDLSNVAVAMTAPRMKLNILASCNGQDGLG